MAIAETTMKRETMSRDLANRSPDIHWPEGFSPDQAALFSYAELRMSVLRTRLEAHCRGDQMAAVVPELKGGSGHCRSRPSECRRSCWIDNLRPAAGQPNQ
jgi:hypothetical protein